MSPGLLEPAESPFLQLHRTVVVDCGEIGTVGGSVKDVLSCPHSYTTLTAHHPSPPLLLLLLSPTVDFLSALVVTKHKDVSVTSGSRLDGSFLLALSYFHCHMHPDPPPTPPQVRSDWQRPQDRNNGALNTAQLITPQGETIPETNKQICHSTRHFANNRPINSQSNFKKYHKHVLY